MSELDKKINEHFPGLVVRKDLVKIVKGNAIVPSYVLEYLLGQYCATSDGESIKSGIETVKEILRKHYVHRNEAGLIKSIIKEKGRHKVIDKISVALNDKAGVYEAAFSNLGVKKILVDSNTVKKHPKLLVSGVWCIADLEYEVVEDRNASPWVLSSIKPIQLSHFDYDNYIESRKKFTTDEWIDLLMQSIGFNPEMFGKRSKLLQLVRLIPYCERNYNVIELGPKGTGKSHIYSEFSPHGILISGGEVTVPKLFVNNNTAKLGLVGYWDAVAFDEFAGRKKRPNKALVDIMKNYMANKSFSRGVETLGAEASMVFIGNTQHTLPYMLKHSDLFDELPEAYHDSAFLDRLHFYIPGWEVDIIRGEMFSDGYGFVVDYLAEILRTLRDHDFSQLYSDRFNLLSDISTRDLDAINKTFSGLMKILFPHEEATEKEIEELLQLAIEGRKRVKDQLMRIDQTYEPVRFGYVQAGKKDSIRVQTLEEKQYPQFYHKNGAVEEQSEVVQSSETAFTEDQPVKDSVLIEKQIIVQENQKGISFDELLGPYLKGAAKITITDPYIRLFHQARNLMELLETIAKVKSDDDEVKVHLVTVEDEFKGEQQKQYLIQIQEGVWATGIKFSWEFDESNSLHARHIITDNGWKILLDRGLDIFQHYDMNQAFSINNRLQKYRSCKTFEVTFLVDGK
jgi:ATP-dependent Lon protease